MRSTLLLPLLLLALAPAGQAFVLEGDLWEAAPSSDLVVVARPVTLQRMRVSERCAYELVTCELERILFARGQVVPVETVPRPRICVFRQLDSDEVHFQRQVLVEGRAYLFALRARDQDFCWSPLSSYHPFPPAEPDQVRRMLQALYGSDGERIDPAPLEDEAALAHLRGALALLAERVGALAGQPDAALLELLAQDGLGQALYAPLAADRRVCQVEARCDWTLDAGERSAAGSLLPAYAPLATPDASEPRQGAPALEGLAPLREAGGVRFFRVGAVLDGLQETATIAALTEVATPRGPVRLQVHVKVGAGPVGAVAAVPDERERHEGLAPLAWLEATCGKARAEVLAQVLRDREAELLHGPAQAALADLGRAGVPAALGLLDADEEVGLRGLLTLADMGPAAAEALPAVARVAGSSAGLVRAQALTTLGQIGAISSASQAALEGGLQSQEERTRVAAADALGALGPLAACSVPALLGALGDPEPTVQAAAAASLGEVGPAASQAAPALRELVASTRHEQLLRAATGALPRVGAPASEVVPALLQRLEAGPAVSEVWWPVCETLARYGAGAAAALPFLRRAEAEQPAPLSGFAAMARRAIEAGLELERR